MESDFPRVTTIILQVHTDEVWNIEWSHDGLYLASASKDKSAIIWRTGSSAAHEAGSWDWTPHFVLRGHPYPVGCLVWSKDDSVLLTSSDNYIKLWNTKTGVCINTLNEHTDIVTALSWLPDGSGFISGGLDRKIIRWEADGRRHDAWGATAIRITDLAVTPDFTRLVTVGMEIQPGLPSTVEVTPSREAPAGDAPTPSRGNRMIVFNLPTKQTELSIRLEGELTSVKVSQNSQYALINHLPDEVHLWDLNAGRVARKYTGQRQGRHVIRSCFGGIDENFVISGSEDGNVYTWHRDTGALLEVLSGHGEGTINSVAWNPHNGRMFASCSDDNTIRIWGAPPPQMSINSNSHNPSHTPPFPGTEEDKTQERWDEDNVDSVSGSNATRI